MTISDNRYRLFAEIDQERKRQDKKWGEQNHSMVDPRISLNDIQLLEDKYKLINDRGQESWYTILMEEVCEAFSETDPANQRAELVQVAAVVVQILEYLDKLKPDDYYRII